MFILYMKKLWLVSKDSEINSILSNNVNIEAAVCTLAAPKGESTHGKGQPCLQLHALSGGFTGERKLLNVQVREAVWKMF